MQKPNCSGWRLLRGLLLCFTLSLAIGVRGEAPGAWLDISAPVTSQVKSNWPGLTAGIAVDRRDGGVFMIPPGEGVWRSSDHGASFTRVDGKVIGGRCETGFALCMDPAGGRLFCFMLDGPSGYTLDGGRTWTGIAQVGRGWDYAAVDWSSAVPGTLYGLEHESGGKVWLSTDTGRTWSRLGEAPAKGNAAPFGVGVFDAKTLVRWQGRDGIERSTDTGATWTKVSEEIPIGHVMTVLNGDGYWLGEKGLLVSHDRGATWSVQGGSTPGASWGPYFGRDAAHVVVAGRDGIRETRNGGKEWKPVIGLPMGYEGLSIPGWFLNLGFDPAQDVFYASRMGKPAYRYQRTP